MDSDKQSAKNGKGAPKRRISALQKVAGSIPAGSDVGSSLDDFIATANQTLTDTDAFKLTSDITGESQKKKDKEEAAAAALDAAAAQNAAELARVAAEEAARKVLAEVTRKSAQQVAQLEAKLAQAEARATSVERKVRAPRAPSVPPLASLSIDEGPDFAEGSFSQSFGLVAMRRRRANALKAIGIMGAAAVIAGGVFLLGNGRLWNKPEKNNAVAPAVAAAKPAVSAPAAKPAVSEPAPAPAVTALPDQPAVAEVRAEAPKAAQVEAAKVEPAPAPQPAAAAQQPSAVPLVSSLAPVTPTVTPLDGDGNDHAARKSSKKKRTASHKKASAGSTSSGGKKASGGIVDPFAP